MTSEQVVVLGVVALSFLAAAMAGRRASLQPGVLTAEPLIAVDLFDPNLQPPREPRLVTWFEAALGVLALGYVLFDKAAAWLHVPGTPAFVGELVLLLGIGAMLGSTVRLGPALRAGAALKALAFYMGWGAILMALALPGYGIDAIRDSAIWYYGAFALLVAFLLSSDPSRVRRWTTAAAKVVPVVVAWMPLAIILPLITPLGQILVPDSIVSILDHKPGNIAVVGAIVIAFLWMVDAEGKGRFNTRQRFVLTVIAGGTILLAGFQNRGGLVAASLAMLAMLVLLRRKRTELTLSMVGVGAVVIALLFATGVRIPLSGGREISSDQLVSNITSIFDPDEGGHRQSSTAEWRLQIWTRVLDDVANEVPITGFGPGPNLGARYGVETNETEPLRNPHNSHMSILARLGFVGAALWIVLWIVWVLELAQHRVWLRRQGLRKEHGLAGWVVVAAIAILVNAVFDPTLEGPQVGVLLWLIFGLGAMLPVLHRKALAPQVREASVSI